MIELEKPVALQKAVEAISSFISEGNFRFSDNGISFRAIDPSQVLMVDYSFEKSAFQKYDVEPSLVGLDVVELSKILSRASETDKLMMDLSDAELKIRLEGEISRSFHLPLIDVSDEELTLPETEFGTTIEVSARIMKEALKDASIFGSTVLFSTKSNQFLIEAKGTQGMLKSVLKQAKHLTLKGTSEVNSKYSLNFLQNIVKAASPEQKILFEMKSDAPLRVSYPIGPGKIAFHLAHMIL